jgi:hypothetical protein
MGRCGLVKRSVALGAVLVAVVLAATSCGEGDADQREFAARNDALLDGLPMLPNASLKTAYVHGDTSGNGHEEGGPIVSYWSTRKYDTPAGAGTVLRFYRRALRSRWNYDAGTGCDATFLNGDTWLHVDACGDGFTLSVNWDTQPP